MTYVENIFVCLAAPLIVAAVCMGKKYSRFFIFCMSGMAMCLLSAYINTFLAFTYGADIVSATVEITPVVEELMKLLPLLFYLLVFEPHPKDIRTAVIIVAASFATFENIVYLTGNGAAELPFLLVRGFGTGAMHIVCGAMVGFGLVYVWQRHWLRIAGTFGLLCAAITFHAIYNLLLSGGGLLTWVAYSLPLLTVAVGMGLGKLFNFLKQ